MNRLVLSFRAASLPLVAFATLACAPPAFVVHDVSRAFTDFAVRAQAMPPAERLAAFEREITPLAPIFYRWKLDALQRAQHGAAPVLDEHVQRHAALGARYEQVRTGIIANLKRHGTSFRAAFPDFAADLDVWVLHSLGELDGGVREIGGRTYFFLGVDNIARYHTFDDQGPFFHHELFHLYQRSFFESGDELWGALWKEGLAVHVSRQLNPSASAAELLLDTPAGLSTACEARRREIFGYIRERLRSTRQDDYAALFLLRARGAELPRRSGYWAGEQVARVLGRTRSLRELARWRGDTLRVAVEEAVDALAR